MDQTTDDEIQEVKTLKLAPIFTKRLEQNESLNGLSDSKKKVNNRSKKSKKKRNKRKCDADERRCKKLKECRESDVSHLKEEKKVKIIESITPRRSERLKNVANNVDHYDSETEEYWQVEEIEDGNNGNENERDYESYATEIDETVKMEPNHDIEVIDVKESSGEHESCSQQVAVTECFLWTEKYKPIDISQLVGHKKACSKLKFWLDNWNSNSNRLSGHEHGQGDDSFDSLMGTLDDSYSCVLISGPTGCGKTSLVYAVAEEMSLKVFELNASVKRSGREVLKQVGEATQSHHVQCNHLNGTTSDSQTQSQTQNESGSLPQQIETTKIEMKVIEKPKSAKSQKKANPKNGIMKYFASKSQVIEETVKETIELDVESNINATSSIVSSNSNSNDEEKVKSISFTSNSIILIDDVDILLEDDFQGFWHAVNSINEMTKKPLILTATQSIAYIRDCVQRLQVISIEAPTKYEIAKYLKMIYDEEMNEEKEEKEKEKEKGFRKGVETLDDKEKKVEEEENKVNDQKEVNGVGIEDGKTDEECSEDKNEILIHDEIEQKDEIDLSTCEYVAEACNGDIRRCLNEVQFNASSWKEKYKHDIKCKANSEDEIISDSMLEIDIIGHTFNLMNIKDTREMWMRCLPQEDFYSFNQLEMAKEMIESIKELSQYERHDQVDHHVDDSIIAIHKHLERNTSLQSIGVDYLPYISYICNEEYERFTSVSQHSRRSRRFMHHLDSIGLFINDETRQKLASFSFNSL